MFERRSLFIAVLLVSLTIATASNASVPPTTVILDTDIASDVDDVGALYLLNYYQSVGKCKILAVIVDQKLPASAGACKAIDSYWGDNNIPVGQISTANASTDWSPYAVSLTESLLGEQQPTRDAVSLYRRILTHSKDHSVTLICIGHETAVDALLRSVGDNDSNFSGADLVARKVSQVIVMGGDYSMQAGMSHKSGFGEFNFATDAKSTSDMISKLTLLRIPTVYIGAALGSSVHVGGMTKNLPFNSPLREAYRLYNGNIPRDAWDVIAAYYACNGLGAVFAATAGNNVVDATNGWNDFETNNAGTQAYLTLAVTPEALQQILDGIYAKTPAVEMAQ